MLTMLIFFFFCNGLEQAAYDIHCVCGFRHMCLNDVTHRHWLHCFKCKKPLSLAHHYGFLKGREGYVLLKVCDSQTLQATCSTLSLWHHTNSPGFLWLMVSKKILNKETLDLKAIIDRKGHEFWYRESLMYAKFCIHGSLCNLNFPVTWTSNESTYADFQFYILISSQLAQKF